MTLFIANKRGIGQVATGRDVRKALLRRAEEIADDARRIVRAEAYETGELHDSITVNDQSSGDRTDVRVVAGTDHADDVEFGTEDTQPVRFLGRASDAGS